jgi:hypothetical protein
MMINPPITLFTKEAREVAEQISNKLESIKTPAFSYVARNSLCYLARIAQECFNDLKNGESLVGDLFKKAIEDAKNKFDTAYETVVHLKEVRKE